MTGNSNTRSKARSISLVLMLVLSVFAGSLAFAGSAAAHELSTYTTDDPGASVSTDTPYNHYVSIYDGERLTGIDVTVANVSGTGSIVLEKVNPSSGTYEAVESTGINGDGTYVIGSSGNFATYASAEYRLVFEADNSSSYTVDYVTVNKDLENNAPTADAGSNLTVQVGETFNVGSAGSSDPDGDNLTYLWDIASQSTASTKAVTTSFDSAGTYTITLTVEDEHGATDTDTMTVTVENQTTDDGSSDDTTTTDDGSTDDTTTDDGTSDDSDNTTTTTDSTTTEEPVAYDVTFNVADNGTEVANASVVVTQNGTEVANFTTDANGSTVASLEDGNYSFTVSADGTNKTGDVVVDGDKTVSVDLADDEGGVVIIDAGGGSSLSGSQMAGIAGIVVALLALFGLLALAGRDY